MTLDDEPVGFRLSRRKVPVWVNSADLEATVEMYGDDPRWAYGIPGMYRALNSPGTGEVMVRAPQPDEPFDPAALAYWTPLVQLALFTFGWRRVDVGFANILDQGWIGDVAEDEVWYPLVWDRNVALVDQVWIRDGQFGFFLAWLWGSHLPPNLAALFEGLAPTRVSEERFEFVSDEWLRQQALAAERRRLGSPYNGGGDALHLSAHCSGPVEPSRGSPVMSVDEAGATGVLVVDGLRGWYRALHELADQVDDSVCVEVFTRSWGRLGVFTRSPTTRLWHSTTEEIHLAGNPAAK